jgi:hypothetical protein
VDAAGEVADEVERRLVGPVRVLDDEEVRLGARRAAERGHEPGEELLARDAGRPHVVRQHRQHLGEGPERDRRRRTVARADRDAGRPRGRARGGVDERRLADPRLTRDEHQPPVAGSGVGQVPLGDT